MGLLPTDDNYLRDSNQLQIEQFLVKVFNIAACYMFVKFPKRKVLPIYCQIYDISGHI